MPATNFATYRPAAAPVRLQIMLGKHTELSLFSGPEFLLFQSQGIKPLVMFSEGRLPELPDVPTAREIGIGTVFEERIIAFAPKGTPSDRIDVIAGGAARALDDPDSSSVTRASVSTACLSRAPRSDGCWMI